MGLDRRKKLELAERLLAQGKLQAALIEFDDLARGAPSDLLTLNRVGDLLAKVGRNRDAVRYYRQIADHFVKAGFFPKAVAIHKKILRLTPDGVESFEELGELYRLQRLPGEARTYLLRAADMRLHAREFARARAIYEKVVANEPHDPRHRARLAEARAAEGETAKAGQELLALGEALLGQSQVDEAERVFRRAGELSPRHHGPAIGLARCLEARGRIDAALQALSAAEGGEGASEISAARFALLERAGRSAEAASLLDASSSDIPDAAIVAVFGRAMEGGKIDATWATYGPILERWRERGWTARAVRLHQEIASLDPDGHLPALERMIALVEAAGSAAELAEARRRLLRAYENRGMKPQAEELVLRMATGVAARVEARQAVTADDASPSAAVTGGSGEGLTLPRTVRDAEAPAVPLNRADEEFVTGRLTQAEILDKYGLREEALRQLREVVDRFPGHVNAHERHIELLRENAPREELRDAWTALGLARRASGDGDGARRAVAEAEALQPAEGPTRTMLERLGLLGTGRAAAAPARPQPSRGALGKREEAVTIDFDAADEEPADLHEVPAAAPPPVPAPAPALAPALAPAPVRAVRRPALDVVQEISELLGRGELPEARRRVDALVTLGFEGPELADLLQRVAPPVTLATEAAIDSPALENRVQATLDEDDDLSAITAALERDLLADDLPLEPAADAESEQSIDEVFAAFRQHVATEVGDDYRTHYDLGIAYKEMGLVDEAIEQFRRVLTSQQLRPESYAMLAVCHRDRDELVDAAKCYRSAIESCNGDPSILLSLRYDLADVLLSGGDRQGALNEFRGVLRSDPSFRDVRERVAQLES